MLHVAGGDVGDLRLRHRLATGAMGDVWVANTERTGLEAAVKFVAPDRVPISPGTSRAHEARVLEAVRHPHVVEVRGIGWLEGARPFIVMELLRGRTLAAELAARGPLSLDVARRWMEHMASALEHVHAVGIVHRDIKPQNLFVCGAANDTRVKVIDFGLATKVPLPGRRVRRATPPVAGSLAFMNPQDLRDRALPSVQSDLWALSVTAYLMLTMRLPFRPRSAAAWQYPMAWDFELPSCHRADLPAPIDEWFLRAFSREPSERFQSASDGARAFCRATAEKGTAEPSARPCLSDDEILAFALGEMTPVEVQRADSHLGACQACSDVLSTIADLTYERSERVPSESTGFRIARRRRTRAMLTPSGATRQGAARQ